MKLGFIDDHLKRPLFSIGCSKCKHFNVEIDPMNLGKPATCKAFPKGIPDEIWNGENVHLKPFPGDNGIQYEPRK